MFIQKEQKCVCLKFWNSETRPLGYRWFCCKGSHWLDTLLWRFSLVEMDDPAYSTDSKWFTMLHKRWFVGYFYWKDSHWLKKELFCYTSPYWLNNSTFRTLIGKSVWYARARIGAPIKPKNVFESVNYINESFLTT